MHICVAQAHPEIFDAMFDALLRHGMTPPDDEILDHGDYGDMMEATAKLLK